MRRVYFAALCCVITVVTNAQAKYEKLRLSPEFPKQGKQVSFEFDAGKSTLAAEKNIEIAVYLFSKQGLKVIEPTLTQKGKMYSGMLQLDTGTNCIAFGFSAGDQKDNNAGEGYIIPVYNDAKQPLLDYYPSAAQLYSGYGEYLLGITTNAAKSFSFLEDGIKTYPNAKENDQYLNMYLFGLGAAKKKEAEPIILSELQTIQNKPNIKESELGTLIEWYTKFKNKPLSDSFTALRKKQYPEGEWKKMEFMYKVFGERDAEKKKQLLDAYVVAYPPKEVDQKTIQSIKSQIAQGYAKKKNYAAFKEIATNLPQAERYSIYNNIAWQMAEENENVTEAQQMAKEATEWTKNEVSNPTEKKPENLTKKAWEEKRKGDYAMYGDTYAFILYNAGAYKEGLPFAKDAATINKLKDAELNERYAMLLEKAAPNEEAKVIIEKMVADGKATAKTKEALKNIYVKEQKGDAGFDTYMAQLEAASKLQKNAELVKTMVKEPAPKFILKDFEGKEVSLESLKGKVVVIDFWATWCGPCIASMPGMKKAEEKLKPRGDVVFLFIDTWERVDNKKQNAMDFMKKKNYPFYVLMDDENKVVTDFGVQGIPAKFIIDKDGNIRFKATGFGGNADELVDEMSTMVELASK